MTSVSGFPGLVLQSVSYLSMKGTCIRFKLLSRYIELGRNIQFHVLKAAGTCRKIDSRWFYSFHSDRGTSLPDA